MCNVSVIIPVWNAEKTIQRCLLSLLNQKFVEIEIIVIDDCSTDNTAQIISTNFPSVKYFKTPQNSGPSSARNMGIKKATCEWLAMVDADDTVNEQRIATMIALIDKNTDMIFDNLNIISQADEVTKKEKIFLPKSYFNVLNGIDIKNYCYNNLPYKSEYLIGFLKPIIKKSFLQDNQISYNEKLKNSEDFILVLESLIKGAKIKYTDQALYNYFVYSDSLSGNFDPEAHYKLIKHEQLLLSKNSDILDEFSIKGIKTHIEYLNRAYLLYKSFDYIKSLSIIKFILTIKSDWKNSHFYLSVILRSILRKILNRKVRGS